MPRRASKAIPLPAAKSDAKPDGSLNKLIADRVAECSRHVEPAPAEANLRLHVGRARAVDHAAVLQLWIIQQTEASRKRRLVNYDFITTESHLREFCAELAGCGWIALDTEFISEGSYRPELCLIQVGTPQAFGGHRCDRSERRVCPSGKRSSRATRRRSSMPAAAKWSSAWPRPSGCRKNSSTPSSPPGWPASSIRPATARSSPSCWASRWISTRPAPIGGKRPLSKRQLDYAAEDVYYLSLVRDRIHARLVELGRLGWLDEERQSWCEALCHAMSDDRWRRVSGNASLDPRSLAIVHELWKWREEEARRRNQPARRVLRDDLIVELAKRQTADVKRISAVRGIGARRPGPASRADCPVHSASRSRCRWRNARRGIRGRRRRSFPWWGSSSLRRWAASAARRICAEPCRRPQRHSRVDRLAAIRRRRPRSAHVPKLASGWRAEFVGRLFEDLLTARPRSASATRPRNIRWFWNDAQE